MQRQMTNIFESAYFCEQFISKINVAKNPYRYRLDNEKLNICIYVAILGYLSIFTRFSYYFCSHVKSVNRKLHMRPWDIEMVKNYKYRNNYCNRYKICQISNTTVKEDTNYILIK
jgi:hypothetical protein